MKKPNGTYIEGEMLLSPAFKDLNATCIRIYLGFKRRVRVRKMKGTRIGGRGDYIPHNDQELIYTYKQMMKEAGVSSSRTVTDGIDKLIDLGFVKIVHSAKGEYPLPTQYGMSEQWKKWHPDEAVRERRGFSVKPRHRRRKGAPGGLTSYNRDREQ